MNSVKLISFVHSWISLFFSFPRIQKLWRWLMTSCYIDFRPTNHHSTDQQVLYLPTTHLSMCFMLDVLPPLQLICSLSPSPGNKHHFLGQSPGGVWQAWKQKKNLTIFIFLNRISQCSSKIIYPCTSLFIK